MTVSKKDQRIARALKALGHPVRIQIIRQLLKQGTCFSGDVSARLPVAPSTACQHLKTLKDAGLISGTIDGPRVCYCVNEKALAEAKAWMAKL